MAPPRVSDDDIFSAILLDIVDKIVTDEKEEQTSQDVQVPEKIRVETEEPKSHASPTVTKTISDALLDRSGIDLVKLRQRRKRELFNLHPTEVIKRVKKVKHAEAGGSSDAPGAAQADEQVDLDTVDEAYYTVKKIVECRWCDGAWTYLICWDGKGYKNSWEPHENLTKKLVREFWAQNVPCKIKPKRKRKKEAAH